MSWRSANALIWPILMSIDPRSNIINDVWIKVLKWSSKSFQMNHEISKVNKIVFQIKFQLCLMLVDVMYHLVNLVIELVQDVVDGRPFLRENTFETMINSKKKLLISLWLGTPLTMHLVIAKCHTALRKYCNIKNIRIPKEENLFQNYK